MDMAWMSLLTLLVSLGILYYSHDEKRIDTIIDSVMRRDKASPINDWFTKRIYYSSVVYLILMGIFGYLEIVEHSIVTNEEIEWYRVFYIFLLSSNIALFELRVITLRDAINYHQQQQHMLVVTFMGLMKNIASLNKVLHGVLTMVFILMMIG